MAAWISKPRDAPGHKADRPWADLPGDEIARLEIKAPERIVATEKWDQRWYPGDATGTITLTKEGGVTTLTQNLCYESQTARDMVLGTMIEHAIALGYDRLAELLKSENFEREKKK